MRRHPTLPLYLGGLLGPIGGPIVAVLLPEIAADLDTSLAGAAAGIPAYLAPFAALQVFSGTLAERLGRRRVLTAAYVVYALASLAAAAASSPADFLAARGAQGAANAFLTPLLLAGLADVVPRDRLGCTAGTFAAFQAAGVALAPLLGGFAGIASWRLAFVALAVLALALSLLPPNESKRADGVERPSLAMLFNARVGRLAAAGFAAYAGVAGIGYLVAIRAADAFGVESAARGLLVAAFGLTGMILGRAAGHAVDRFGAPRMVLVGAASSALAVVALSLAGSIPVFAACWAGAGAGAALVWSGVNLLVIEAVPRNRSGAASLAGAFKFAGGAISPIALIPIYTVSPRLAFTVAAGLGLLAGPAVAARVPRPALARGHSVPASHAPN